MELVVVTAGKEPKEICGGGWRRWPRSDGDWSWIWFGGQGQVMRSPLGLLAALAGAGCTGLCLGCAWAVPELSILSAVAAAFWWQVARVA